MRLLRGIAVLAALWLCAAGAAAEALVCVSTEACAALLTAGGAEVVAPGTYSDVYAVVEGERYALGASADGRTLYALADSSGNLLTEMEYELLAADGEAILFRQDDLYGAMDMDGNALLPAAYTQLVSAGGGAFLALATDPNGRRARRNPPRPRRGRGGADRRAHGHRPRAAPRRPDALPRAGHRAVRLPRRPGRGGQPRAVFLRRIV